MSHVIVIDECWIWNGKLNLDGYASFNKMKAHRWSYQRWVGKLLKNFEIDHLCKNRNCVNPNHLEQVTHKENIRRGDYSNNGKHLQEMQSNKTHCPKGHYYSGDNLIIENRTDGGVARRCRICSAEKSKKYLLKKRNL